MASRSDENAPIIPSNLQHRRRPQPLSRADASNLSRWYAEVDRGLLLMIIGLMAIGLLAVAVASPVGALVAARRGVAMGELYYLWRQIFWVCSGILLMLGVGLRSKLDIRRYAVLGTVVGVLALFAVIIFGHEVNGSTRWIGSGMFRLQPSEFLKPLFAVSMGWLLACGSEDEKIPAMGLSFAVTLLISILLMSQPDFGQTVLICGTWLAMAFIAGLDLRKLWWIGGLASAGLVGTYFLYANARHRIDAFLFGTGDGEQVDRGIDTLSNSGLIGSGPFTGTAKFRLPEAHTDYIYSVIGEEFGLFACAGILLLYVALVVRVLRRLREEQDQFVILAGSGLVLQFAGQFLINISVNLHLLPSKGMTLPFISYGGSSLWALCISMGMLLALTRRNPYRARPQEIAGWWEK